MQRQHGILLIVVSLLFISLSLPWTLSPSSTQFSISSVLLQASQAEQAIDAAQTAINSAYLDLALADSTGAQTTDLIGALNNAISVLNQARSAYNATDYSSAITLAENALTTANTVSDQAQFRYLTTLAQLQAQVIIIIAVSVIVALITYFALTRWRKYRKEKRREFLQMEITLPDEQKEGEVT